LEVEDIPLNFRRRVVIADDNRTNQKVLGLFLEKGGFDTVVVGSGDAVLDELWLREPIHAVVLDVSMPGLTGIEVIKLIRFAEPDGRPEERLPIIAVTADDRLQTRRECLDAGANAFLVQPVSPANLVATVKGLISAREVAIRDRSRIVRLSVVSENEVNLPDDIVDRAVVDQLYAAGGAPYLAELAQAVRTDFNAAVGAMRSAIEKVDIVEFRQQAFNLVSATGNLGCARIRSIFEYALECDINQLTVAGPEIQSMLTVEIDLLCDLLLRYGSDVTMSASRVGRK
jgi:two-component system sensor histidine kinase RpfC